VSDFSLSEKVHEMAQFYMGKRNVATPGLSKLRPIPDPICAQEKVLS
jgi:hypothetical protein